MHKSLLLNTRDIFLGIIFLILSDSVFANDKPIYAFCNDKPWQSVQLSPKLIAASKVLTSMVDNGARKSNKVKIPFSRKQLDHLQSFVQNTQYLEMLPNKSIEQLHTLCHYFELIPSPDNRQGINYNDLIAAFLWKEWQNGYKLSVDVLLNMKQDIKFGSNQIVYNEVFNHFLTKVIVPTQRQFQNINANCLFVGQKYIGFWEKKDDTLLSSIFPRYVAYFMRLKKIFKDNYPSLQDCIRNNAETSIDISINKIDSNALVFRDDKRGFTLIECKKNGALHRWQKGLKTYNSNFENVSDVCYTPPYGYFMLYNQTNGFELLFFNFEFDKKHQRSRKEFYPYNPWIVSSPTFKHGGPVVLGWDSSDNACRLIGISQYNDKPTTFVYKSKHPGASPSFLGQINAIPEYNAINQRNCLHKYQHSLAQVGFYSKTPNNLLWLINMQGKLVLHNMHENVFKELMSYNNEEVYFLSNTLLLVEDTYKKSMLFVDMTRFNLIKERFSLWLAE